MEIQMFLNTNFAAECHRLSTPFYGWGSEAIKPLRGGSLLFITKSPEIPGIHFIDLGKKKD